MHFLRFQLDDATVEKFKSSSNIIFGAEHDIYAHIIKINSETKNSLLKDFD